VHLCFYYLSFMILDFWFEGFISYVSREIVLAENALMFRTIGWCKYITT